jgi:aminopeptidase-like protein
MSATTTERLQYLQTNSLQETGKELYNLISELYPICRSITGDGVRQTLNLLKRIVPVTVHEVPSGTKVFDWTVPQEWNIRDAYIKDSKGKRIVDFKDSNLHVVNYSVPVKRIMSLGELKEHLFTLPEKPDWIPYRTSYYRETWGFCLTHNQISSLKEDQYEVCIDSSLKDGHLTYGEFFLPGEISDEVIVSTHICHPSLCNDNLSGISIASYLARTLSTTKLRYSYRFLFLPATIGSITWLALNESNVLKIKHGLVLACAGDTGKSTYKRSRRGNAEVDRAVSVVLKDSGQEYELEDFFPYGYDERQYCSPGFNLPVGSLMRTPNGRFPEYHTSADNLDFVKPHALADSFSKALSIIFVLEHNRRFLNQNPKCEPQLGRRGIYRALSDQKDGGKQELAMLWVLNLSDGEHTLLDIAEKSALTFETIYNAATLLLQHELLKELTNETA